MGAGEVLGVLQGLLRFEGQLVELHIVSNKPNTLDVKRRERGNTTDEDEPQRRRDTEGRNKDEKTKNNFNHGWTRIDTEGE
jgi:hypothetical protein